MIVNRKSSLRALEIFTWNTLYLLKEEMTFRFLMTIVWHETFNQIVHIISFANSQGTSFHDLSCPSIKRSLFKTPITKCMCHNCINVSNWVIIEIARSSFFQSALNVYCSSFSPNTSAMYIYFSSFFHQIRAHCIFIDLQHVTLDFCADFNQKANCFN